jgi:hypothetical protein
LRPAPVNHAHSHARCLAPILSTKGETSQPLVGMLLERRNSGGPGAGLAALTAGDFRFAFLPLVFFMVVGLLAAILVKETLADKHPPGAVQTVPVNRAALS